MAYTITLSDDEYAALAAEAQRTGESIEALVRAAVRARYATAEAAEPKRTGMSSSQGVLEHLYRAGVIANIPTGRPASPEEEAELERLANSVLPGMSAADMVIEDRGPR